MTFLLRPFKVEWLEPNQVATPRQLERWILDGVVLGAIIDRRQTGL